MGGNSSGKKPFGLGSGKGPQGAKGPSDWEDIPECDPALLDLGDPKYFSLGATGPKWEPWMKDMGCAFIAALKVNEKRLEWQDEKWGASMGRGKTVRKPILTPENVNKLHDCYEKCADNLGFRYPGPGVGNTGPEKECLRKCKEEFMLTEYELPVDTSSWTTAAAVSSLPHSPGEWTSTSSSFADSTLSSSLCPPLCLSGTYSISIFGHYKCWVWTPRSMTPDPDRPGELLGHDAYWQGPVIGHWNHAMTCQVLSCDDEGVCFECEDHGPQVAAGRKSEKRRLCMNPDGTISYIDSPFDQTGPPGSCEKKMNNPNYTGDPMADPNSWGDPTRKRKTLLNIPNYFGNKVDIVDQCCEHHWGWTSQGTPGEAGKEIAYVSLIWTDVPCESPTGDK
tara:strand:- start:11 stop:1189 length:1179 start_codon:yes stop_codon:yes gene_type:complete